MDLGVARVPQTVESSGPGSDLLRHGETDQSSERSEEDGDHERREECLELLRGEVGSDESDEGDELKEPEDTWRLRKNKTVSPSCKADRRAQERRTEGSHVLRGLEGQETDKGNLHRRQGSDEVPRRVSNVQSLREATHEDQHKGMQRKHCKRRSARLSTS